jgi:hypothetical protein
MLGRLPESVREISGRRQMQGLPPGSVGKIPLDRMPITVVHAAVLPAGRGSTSRLAVRRPKRNSRSSTQSVPPPLCSRLAGQRSRQIPAATRKSPAATAPGLRRVHRVHMVPHFLAGPRAPQRHYRRSHCCTNPPTLLAEIARICRALLATATGGPLAPHD